ncbi:hypothetical protein TON_0433 [Thermococcus onnurineus NA1]|uniref:DUF835 domain-containing protein n=1 Tax=Thermococcus onnurineus (strain NA1) TaxID=523850 RepID=B6YTN1_THEON|nr:MULTISPECIES: DUF257 family protein [Thermococcus]ACJ15918.1 hypothetical protein TON_0433 [Thermococcus onnurineus NA1]NJE46415.1 hypothetical protein [Thermococcus sp. GR7]NJE77666.1 hypothetical protein [Thermococcus sp. GR4]NJF23959.1 hypothetical protein [Thermococcus sp. GR5]
MKLRIDRFLESPTLGDTILVRYLPTDHPELLFYSTVRHALEKEENVIIVDAFSTFHIFTTFLALSGRDVTFLKDIPTVRIGGIAQEGRVVSTINPFNDVSIFAREFARKIEEIATPGTRIFFLGAGKLLSIWENNPYDLSRFFIELVMKTRIKKRFHSVIFANVGVLRPETFEKLEFYLPIILEIKEGGKKAEIIKHLRLEFVGLEVVP